MISLDPHASRDLNSGARNATKTVFLAYSRAGSEPPISDLCVVSASVSHSLKQQVCFFLLYVAHHLLSRAFCAFLDARIVPRRASLDARVISWRASLDARGVPCRASLGTRGV